MAYRIGRKQPCVRDKIQLDWRHFIQEGGTETYVFPPEDVILSDGKLYMLAPNEYGVIFTWQVLI